MALLQKVGCRTTVKDRIYGAIFTRQPSGLGRRPGLVVAIEYVER